MRTPHLALAAGAALSATAAAQDAARAYSAELRADAAGRASAQGGDRAFSVDVHGYTQFRYIYTHVEADDATAGDEDDSAIGFQAARTKVNVSGNVINEQWGYFVQMAFDRSGGGGFLEDAYTTYKSDGGWSLMFGQFKLPLLREELVGETRQLAIDRTPTNETFSQRRSQGVQLSTETDTIRFAGAFSDGLRTINSDYLSPAEADFALTGRFEYKWAGVWEQFRDFTSFPNSEYAGMFGVAGHYQTGGETFGTVDADSWLITADVSMEGNGWNVFAAGIYANSEPEGGDDRSDWAWLIQGGYFVAPQLELFARFDMVLPEDDAGEDEFSTITAGVNYYIVPESHVAKFTAELVYFLDEQASSIVSPNTLIPLLASTDDGQFAIAAQFQLVF